MSQPPRIGPKIGPSSIGTPRIAMRRPIRAGPAALVMIVMPSGMSMPPPRPCRVAEADEHADRGRHGAQRGAQGEEEERHHVEALGAEAVGGPARQGDDGGEGQRVRGDRPGDGRVGQGLTGRTELDLEGRERDVDDGDVEDRHDRAEDDDTGDLEDGTVDLVGVVRWRGRRGGGGHVGLQVRSADGGGAASGWDVVHPARRVATLPGTSLPQGTDRAETVSRHAGIPARAGEPLGTGAMAAPVVTDARGGRAGTSPVGRLRA